MTQLNVLFKSMQRDDKKEILKFQIAGNSYQEEAMELFEMSGNIVVFQLPGLTEEVTAEFVNIQRDDKKTVLKFALKGDSEDQAQALYSHAGNTVPLTVKPSQMTVEEFYEEDEHEGLEYSVNRDGTVNVDSDQLSIDDVGEDGESSEAEDNDDDNELLN